MVNQVCIPTRERGNEKTAAEIVYTRADAEKTNMGLTTWQDAPDGKIQKFDVSIAKNYLTDNELAQLQRLVNAYLDIAEDMAQRQIPMTMQDCPRVLVPTLLRGNAYLGSNSTRVPTRERGNEKIRTGTI